LKNKVVFVKLPVWIWHISKMKMKLMKKYVDIYLGKNNYNQLLNIKKKGNVKRMNHNQVMLL